MPKRARFGKPCREEQSEEAAPMSETATAIDQTGNWIKTVRNKTMLIPTVDTVRSALGSFTSDAGVDATALRRALAEQFGSDGTCPVTVRRHLKELGVPAVRKAAAKQ
jgi:hypothetical protein